MLVLEYLTHEDLRSVLNDGWLLLLVLYALFFLIGSLPNLCYSWLVLLLLVYFLDRRAEFLDLTFFCGVFFSNEFFQHFCFVQCPLCQCFEGHHSFSHVVTTLACLLSPSRRRMHSFFLLFLIARCCWRRTGTSPPHSP